jgi:hypothetical protein
MADDQKTRFGRKMVSWKTDKTITDIKKDRKGFTVGLHNKYPVIKLKGLWYLKHQLNVLTKYKLKKIPKDFRIHHIDKDHLNFRFENLILIHKKDHDKIHSKKDKLKITNKFNEDEFFTEEEIEEVIKKLENLKKG